MSSFTIRSNDDTFPWDCPNSFFCSAKSGARFFLCQSKCHFLFQKIAWLQQALVILGGLYLFYLGIQLFKSAFNQQASVQQLATAIPKSKLTLLLQGFFTNMANPKALVYFSSVFSLAINADMPLTTQSSLLALIWLESLIWFALVAYLFSWHKMNAAYQRLSQWIDGLTGGIFISFGCYLILNRD